MALTALRVIGSYIVPAGKLAKVTLNSISGTSGKYINIGDYRGTLKDGGSSQDCYFVGDLEEDASNSIAMSSSASPSSAYLVITTLSGKTYTQTGILRNHILVPGQEISMSSGSFSATVLLEDI